MTMLGISTLAFIGVPSCGPGPGRCFLMPTTLRKRPPRTRQPTVRPQVEPHTAPRVDPGGDEHLHPNGKPAQAISLICGSLVRSIAKQLGSGLIGGSLVPPRGEHAPREESWN